MGTITSRTSHLVFTFALAFDFYPGRGEFRSIILATLIPFWPFLPFSEFVRAARLCATETACGEQENADDLLG
jgi:hypothetical protein